VRQARTVADNLVRALEKRVRVLIDRAISPFFARDIALTSTDPPAARPGRRPAQRGPSQIV
jgi:hypothetical protein